VLKEVSVGKTSVLTNPKVDKNDFFMTGVTRGA